MGVNVDLAVPADDAAIRRLMREPMPGRITVTFEREPDFSLGCAAAAADCRILVARDENNRIVGVATRSQRKVFINGKPQILGYLGDLRISRDFQGRWLVSRGFSLLRDLDRSTPLPAYLVAIVDGNGQAAGILVEKRRKLFPQFHPVAEYRTLAIDVARRLPLLACDAVVSPGKDCDLRDIADFLRASGSRRQFFPVWDEPSLRALSAYGLKPEDLLIARREGKILGVMSLWDQSAYKQTVVQGYSGWLRALAPLWNAGANLLGRSRLPRTGELLRSAYASLVCVAADDQRIFSALLRATYSLANSRGFSYLLVGLDARDPLLPEAQKYRHILYPSRLYLAEWSDGGHLHERLEQRPAYVDIATL